MLSSGCVGAKTLAERDWRLADWRPALTARLRQAPQTEREEGALGARTSHHLWPVRWRLSLRQERAGAPLIRGRYAACATAGRRWHAGRWVAVVVALTKGKAEEGWPSEQQSNATQRSAAGRTTIRREAGQRARATRLPGESRDGGGGGSGCELTPSHVLG